MPRVKGLFNFEHKTGLEANKVLKYLSELTTVFTAPVDLNMKNLRARHSDRLRKNPF